MITTIITMGTRTRDHHHHRDEASAWGPPMLGTAGADRSSLVQARASAIVAVGLRPCSGAIIVLVFALAQGLFWIGVASTLLMGIGTAITVAAIATLAVGARGLRPAGEGEAGSRHDFHPRIGNRGGAGHRVFGTALLTGYMVSERLMGV
jgi:nickel/cobalt exporter